MTKPIRNTGPCFHLSLPRQRGQRDVLSHTEFINVHILHALSLPGHPLRVTRKPPTADWWVLLLALPEETSITINFVPCVKCAPETATRWWGLSRELSSCNAYNTTCSHKQLSYVVKTSSNLQTIRMFID